MADDPNATNTPPAGGTQPPAGQPPAAAGQQSAPAPARPNGQKNQQGKQGKRKPPVESITIPASAFTKRVRQDALAHIQRELGVSLEDAKKLLQQAKSGGGAPAAANQAAQVETAKMRAESDRLRKQNEQLQRQNGEAKRRSEQQIRALQDQIVERDLTILAREKGITDPDYALFHFAKAQAGSKEPFDPAGFFDAMRTSHPHVFTAQAPRPVPANTAPPLSTAPGGAAPPPVQPAPGPGKQEDVNSMEFDSFQKRTSEKYGFTPGRF